MNSVFRGLFVALLVVAPAGHASVVVHGTRVVYPGEKNDVMVRLENKGERPSLVQVWVDDGDKRATAISTDAPFTLTPPVFRMEPHRQQVVRIRHSGGDLPADRESLFWLNVLEMPPRSADHAERSQMLMSFRTRIRVFYRPDGLPYAVTDAPRKVQWALQHTAAGYVLAATNPSPYFLSLTKVELVSDGQRFQKAPGQQVNDGLLLPGGAVKHFALPGLTTAAAAGAKVEFTAVSDYGARVAFSSPLSP